MVTTNQVTAAVQTIISTAGGIQEVYSYIPTTLSTPEVIFVYHEPPTDETKTNNLTRRTYHMSIWLLVQYVENDDTGAEARFNDLADSISLALLGAKTLGGVVRSTALNDIAHNPLVEIDRVIFRARLWQLDAWVDITTPMS